MRPPRPAALVVAVLSSVLLGLSTGLPSATASELPPVPPATAPVTAEPPAPVPVEPALTPHGRAADGWARYRLADGRLPDPAPAGEGFRGEVHFVHDGVARAVRVLVPPGTRRPAPLLVALHGLHQTATSSESVQKWGPQVRRTGVVLAYGMGTSASWNAGTCCGRAAAEGVDDVGYLDRVLAISGALHPLDARRHFLTGFSNGAMMAYRYTCERPGRIAAVLAVAGTVTSTCRGRTRVAVLHVHGSGDRTVPLAGTPWSSPLVTALRPVSRTAAFFGPTVVAKVLRGHGHSWPTRTRGRYDATTQGWAFLAAHPKP